MNGFALLVEVVEQRTGRAGRRAGRNVRLLCPVHDDHAPSLDVAEGDDGAPLVICRSCGAGLREVAEALGESIGVFLPDRVKNPMPMVVARKPAAALPTEAEVEDCRQALLQSSKLLARLEELRGWTATAIEALGLGIEGERIVIPVRDRHGALVNVLRYQPNPERRSETEPKLLALAGRPRDLWPAPETAQEGDGFLWLVEGEPDAVRAHALGLAAVAVPGTGKWSDAWPARFSGRRVVVCMDADPAGRAAAEKIARILVGFTADLRVVDLDQSVDDGLDLSEWTAAAVTADERAEARHVLEQIAAATPTFSADAVNAERSVAEVLSASSASTAYMRAWPASLGAAALHGLAGRFVALIEPQSEADPAALLGQFLVFFGAAVGSGAHVLVEADRHTANLFMVVVGQTARARKGTSEGHVRRLMLAVDPGLSDIASGLSSGEGLIHAIRDSVVKVDEDGCEKIMDDGVTDKRLLVVESEFGSVLKVMAREGNTLSPVLRNAWDGKTLRVLTRNSPIGASKPHVALVGHITAHELDRHLSQTDTHNGLANRILWVCARRSKKLPFGGSPDTAVLAAVEAELRHALAHGSRLGRVNFTTEARTIWEDEYDRLSRDRPGLLGAVTTRAEPITIRLALIYAILDRKHSIEPEHLRAALAFWQYAERSATHIFSARTGDPNADRIHDALCAAPDGLTREQIRSDVFQRNTSAKRIDAALGELHQNGLATMTTMQTAGRSAEVWRAATGAGASET